MEFPDNVRDIQNLQQIDFLRQFKAIKLFFPNQLTGKPLYATSQFLISFSLPDFFDGQIVPTIEIFGEKNPCLTYPTANAIISRLVQV